VFRVHVALLDLTPACERQLDFLSDDDRLRRKWESASVAIDRINAKYGKTLTSIGPWSPPPGGHAGGKISYTRIPRAEDFW
jgi:DNA polymerase-4